MSTDTIRVTTVAPLHIPFYLKTGAQSDLTSYPKLLQEIGQLDPDISITGGGNSQQYQDIKTDDGDSSVFSWNAQWGEATLKLHVFPNQIAIAEVNLPRQSINSAEQLQNWAQQQSNHIIEQSWPRLLSLLDTIQQSVTSPLLLPNKRPEQNPSLPSIDWTSRTLHIQAEQLSQTHCQDLIKDWLADTQNPQDAEEIIAGTRQHSMTWLNYIVVDKAGSEAAEPDYRIETMILAQYYYAAQENCLKQLKKAISAAYIEDQLKAAETELSQSRVITRLHLIDYHEQLKLLTRPKRKLLAEILASWEFDNLVENSQRMIDVCSSRLEEVDHQRRERSTVMTDLLLVTLSFFAVFELSLYLVQFSREMMSRPALDYNDDSTSFFLSLIAEIDTDIMFGFGFLLTLCLVLVYKRIKSH